VATVRTLLGHGGPIQALVAALGLDERTGAAWLRRAGRHGPPLQQAVVQQGGVALPPVQAEELWGKLVGRRGWLAMALAVPSRLWRGGVISPHRDWPWITARVQRVRTCARPRAILGCVDGLASDVTAILRVFRPPVSTGRRGRPRRARAPGVLVGQGVKRSAKRHVVRVEPRVVRGTKKAIAALRTATHTGTGINTADLERLQATCRASLAPLVRRGRALAHTEARRTAGRWLVGGAYPFGWRHASLGVRAPAGACWPWEERPPVMAAGRMPHRWTIRELRRDQVPLPAWGPPQT
jgi:hypothetical protein